MRKITDLKENEVVHCSTQEEVDKICKLLHDHGLKCNTGRSYLNTNHFNVCSEKGGICYHVFRGTWECRSTVNNVLVYPASDFLQPSYLQLLEEAKELAKQEGMRVEYTVETDWEGVDFVECVDDILLSLAITKWRVYKIRHSDIKGAIALEGISGCIESTRFKPSTETAYKEQLIKEANERFGVISIGDIFELSNGIPNRFTIGDFMKPIWEYTSKSDILRLSGYSLYKRGVWAKRVEQSFFEKSLKEENEKLKKDIEHVKSILKNYE